MIPRDIAPHAFPHTALNKRQREIKITSLQNKRDSIGKVPRILEPSELLG